MDARRTKLACAAVALLVATAAPAADWPAKGERRSSFDAGWRFQKGELPGAEKPDFDDSAWRALDLPHDWAIEGPFDPKISPHQGALPFFGVAWYRKRFTVPAASDGRSYSLELDGAMSNATVFLNGHELGARPYGYIGFAVDLTPHLNRGGTNVLAVRLAPEPESSRWYPGAGLYRHVWIDATGPVHVARWGTYVTTPAVSDAEATVLVRTELRNREAQPARVTLETAIVDAAGREVARTSTEASVPGSETAATEARLVVPKPVRWDIEHPQLYTAISTVKRGAAVLDRYATPFGIRTIEWGPAKGFLLNGRRVQLQGVCNHHDLGALGTAVNRRALERQLEILKRMGTNAIRTSHNPPAPELLELADRMGFLVMDEAFDMWGRPKVKNGHGKYFAEWGERDLRDMIRRDRNHPSVVMWSIGNEILEQADPEGWKVARRLTDICHEEDKTRPTTAGFNQIEGAIRNKLADQVDIPGFNYGERQYAKIVAEHPDWTIVASETASCVSSRGVYHLPIENYEKHDSLQITSYDVVAPAWAYCPDVEFSRLEAVPSVLGEFVWTGFDYLGEPTPYFAWNKPRDREGLAVAQLLLRDRRPRRLPEGPLLPLPEPVDQGSRWSTCCRTGTGRDSEGQPIPVMAYTNAEEVELLPERPLARPQEEGRALRDARPPEGERRPPVHDQVPARLAGAVPAGDARGRRLHGRQAGGEERREDGGRAGPDRPGSRPRPHQGRRRGPVVRDRPHRGRRREPRAGRRQPGALHGRGPGKPRGRGQRQRRERRVLPGHEPQGLQRTRARDRALAPRRAGSDPGQGGVRGAGSGADGDLDNALSLRRAAVRSSPVRSRGCRRP